MGVVTIELFIEETMLFVDGSQVENDAHLVDWSTLLWVPLGRALAWWW